MIVLLVLMLLISGSVLAAPEAPCTVSTAPAILFFVTDSTGLKDPHGYMLEAINAQYTKKYPAEKFNVISLQNYTNQANINGEPESEDKVIKAAAEAGADYVIRTDLQKVEIRRGIKGIFLKKWCSAEIPVKITIWDVASDKTVFEGVIKEKGQQQESAMGLIVGSVFFVSEEATIKDGLAKIGKRMDKELPLLQ
jgi:hypothetical protein